jgi:polysaccharide export outer membrane protein
MRAYGKQWASIAAGLLLGLGCANAISLPPPEPPPGEREPYVIGVTDSLRITVWKVPELSLEVPVRPDGAISVPLLDDVQAEGLTPDELKEVITAALAEYITAPDVTVIVTQMNSRSVAVMGAVGRSGIIPLRRNMRVLDAIATMGGFNPFAKRNSVKVLRPVEGGLVEYRFNYGAFLAGKAPESNLLLQPGDTIVVPD